ncbi:peptidase M50B-like-domain-containing protein [Paraphysoderma sedebokerense]|nr:peptidase M50B-like-domain-containing protein [Paraphysoderma sedebokerense]
MPPSVLPPPHPDRHPLFAAQSASIFNSSDPSQLSQNILYKLRNPTQEQITTFYIIAAYAVAILFLWNLPYLKNILMPFKLVTVALHEFGHALAGKCTGAKIQSIVVNPDEGGCTTMRGGRACCTLPAGYIGSNTFGALLIFAGFDSTASKVASVILGLCLLVVLYWAKNWLTRGLTIFFGGLIVLFWFYPANAAGLRYFVLFMGVMSCLYSLWDIVEDLVVRKVHSSDASRFAEEFGCFPAQVWGVIWFLISLIFLGAAIVLSLIIW